MGDVKELLATIGAAMALLLGAAKAWARLNQSNERREDRASLKQINDGLMADNDRLRKELVFTEERRDFYRKNAHDCMAELAVVRLELDRIRNELTVCGIQLDAERSARHARDNTELPREEA